MIVKNESHIIVGTLKHLLSVFPITYWVIDDTGSTDGTQTLIRDFFKAQGISGELYETPWRDFGWNRTQAFAHAFNKTDYVVVWDADDSVVGQLPFPALLTADAYKLIFGNSSGFRYGRQQIFNNRRRWRYVGVLHEYPAPAEGEPPAKDLILEGNYWCESGRAGARNRDPNKYLRDAEVLERGLIDEPTNSRYAFYCANSYKDAGRNEQAIAMYKRVLTMGGWAEEKYLACVRIWELSAAADKEAALPFLYESYQHVPDRVEGIYRLVEHFCHTKKERIAIGFYKFVSDLYENRYLSVRQHISRN
jgi:glycosyltransferase involved in cell wall biosynthesis